MKNALQVRIEELQEQLDEIKSFYGKVPLDYVEDVHYTGMMDGLEYEIEQLSKE